MLGLIQKTDFICLSGSIEPSIGQICNYNLLYVLKQNAAKIINFGLT